MASAPATPRRRKPARVTKQVIAQTVGSARSSLRFAQGIGVRFSPVKAARGSTCTSRPVRPRDRRRDRRSRRARPGRSRSAPAAGAHATSSGSARHSAQPFTLNHWQWQCAGSPRVPKIARDRPTSPRWPAPPSRRMPSPSPVSRGAARLPARHPEVNASQPASTTATMPAGDQRDAERLARARPLAEGEARRQPAEQQLHLADRLHLRRR